MATQTSPVGPYDHTKRADECALTVRRGTMALLLVCVTLLAILGKPTGALIEQGKVTLPILNLDVIAEQFIIAAPLVVIFVWLYLQIFLRELRRLERLGHMPSIAVLGSMRGRIPETLAWLIHNLLMPITLAFIAIRSEAILPSPYFTYMTALGLVMAVLRP